jgi:CBS domain-containing protein
MMNLTEFMHTPAVVCPPTATLVDVSRLMASNDVGSVVITDVEGGLAGIVTDRDVAIRGMAHRREPDTPIAELMSPTVVFVREDANVFAAATEMVSAGCRRMPVLDAQGHVKGVIALDDLLTLFARQTDKLAEVVAVEAPRPVMQQRPTAD